MTKIKICGLRRPIDIDYANTIKPDYVGFVFAKSKRNVSYEEAIKLRARLDRQIKAVGVFVNADIKDIEFLVNIKIIQLVQLHGNEDDKYVSELRNLIDVPIIKAYDNYENAQYVLFDNKEPGSGKTFDWSTIKTDKPFFLAGGINKENVLKALNLNPYAIDISSSVETLGYKDFDKMNEIVRMIRNAG